MSKKHTVNPWWVQFGLLFELNKKKFDNWISEFEFRKHSNINIVAFILCGKGLTSSPAHHFAKIGSRNLLFKIALWTRLEKVFTFLCLGLFPFCKCMPRSNLFDSYILQQSLSDLKFYQIGNRRYIQLVVKKKMFCQEVVGGLRTDWFVTVNNFALYLLGKTLVENSCEKMFLIMQGVMSRVSEGRKLLVSHDIGQHHTFEIFRCKKEYCVRDQ